MVLSIGMMTTLGNVKHKKPKATDSSNIQAIEFQYK